MITDQVVALIDEEAVARDTLAFVQVPGETGDEAAAAQFLADLWRREDLEPQFDEAAPGRANVYVHVPGRGPGARSLMFNGHLDTIPIGVSKPPAREGRWVVGRGAEDMRSGLVAMVHASSALRRAGVALLGDLWLTAVVGHEVGKEGPRRLIGHMRSGAMRPDAIIICEGPTAIWTASLGTTIFTLTMTSDLGPIHTSRVPYARNPARWLGELLVRFRDLEEGFEREAPHPLCGREQLNVGLVSGGDYYNRLPTPVTVSGQWRWKPGKTFAQVRAELQALCDGIGAEAGLSFAIDHEGPREAFEVSADNPIVVALRDAGERITGSRPDIVGRAVVGDANLYGHEAGVTTVYYGPAYGTAHSDDERVNVETVTHCARVYALAAMGYCGVA